jgi:hypothetical protein
MPRMARIAFIVLIFGIIACSVPGRSTGSAPPPITPTKTPAAAEPSNATPTVQEAATQTNVMPPTLELTEIPVVPTAVPAPSTGEPAFSPEIRFGPDPDTVTTRRVFPQPVQEIFAVWEYTNMREGLTIRREWRLDGELWIEREEPWDFEKYGASGVVTDISIYDYDEGLPPGFYELNLYIDGQPQFLGVDNLALSFLIVEIDPVSPVTSPDGRLTASVEPPGTLIVEEDDVAREVITTDEIGKLAWFPDSQHIVYTYVDRSKQDNSAPFLMRWELWVVDVTTGMANQLSVPDERLRDPSVSPDGHYVAALGGTGYADACGVDLILVFIELGDSFQRIASYRLDAFADLPTPSGSARYPLAQDDLPLPGVWENATQFKVGLSWTCLPDNDPSGIYRLDVPSLQSERIGDVVYP